MEPIQDTSDNDCLALLDAACAATRSQLAVASQQTAELQRENKSHVAALEAARAEAASARAEAAGLREGLRSAKEQQRVCKGEIRTLKRTLREQVSQQ